MTSGKACQERRVCQVSGSRAVDKKGCQDSDMSEASQIKRLCHQQTKMSGIQKRQRQRLLRDQAADGRASQAVNSCSYRLSLVFIGSSRSRNFRHPACPALLVGFKHAFGQKMKLKSYGMVSLQAWVVCFLNETYKEGACLRHMDRKKTGRIHLWIYCLKTGSQNNLHRTRNEFQRIQKSSCLLQTCAVQDKQIQLCPVTRSQDGAHEQCHPLPPQFCPVNIYIYLHIHTNCIYIYI